MAHVWYALMGFEITWRDKTNRRLINQHQQWMTNVTLMHNGWLFDSQGIAGVARGGRKWHTLHSQEWEWNHVNNYRKNFLESDVQIRTMPDCELLMHCGRDLKRQKKSVSVTKLLKKRCLWNGKLCFACIYTTKWKPWCTSAGATLWGRVFRASNRTSNQQSISLLKSKGV